MNPMMKTIGAITSVLALAACGASPEAPTESTAASSGALGTNLLLNPSFETANTNLVPLYSGFIDHGTCSAPAFAGWGTAALDWPATSNDLSFGTVTTWLTNEHSPTTAVGTHSILVASGTTDGGIAQQYLGNGNVAPLHQLLTVHVKVLAGRVSAGLGNNTWVGSQTSKWVWIDSKVDPNASGPQWETISVCAPVGVGANEVAFYALDVAPATFYVDDASVVVNSAACPF
jgi:hypothetical protein